MSSASAVADPLVASASHSVSPIVPDSPDPSDPPAVNARLSLALVSTGFSCSSCPICSLAGVSSASAPLELALPSSDSDPEPLGLALCSLSLCFGELETLITSFGDRAGCNWFTSQFQSASMPPTGPELPSSSSRSLKSIPFPTPRSPFLLTMSSSSTGGSASQFGSSVDSEAPQS